MGRCCTKHRKLTSISFFALPLAVPLTAAPLPLPLVTTGAVSTVSTAVDRVTRRRAATCAAAAPVLLLTRTTGRETRAEGATAITLEALSDVACILARYRDEQAAPRAERPRAIKTSYVATLERCSECNRVTPISTERERLAALTLPLNLRCHVGHVRSCHVDQA